MVWNTRPGYASSSGGGGGMAPWLIPLILGGGSFLSGLFGGKRQRQNEDRQYGFDRERFQWEKDFQERQANERNQQNWWNDWRSTWPTYNTSSFRSSTESEGGGRQTTTPFVTAQYKGLEGLARQTLEQRIAGGLPPGIEEQGVRGINRTFDATNKAVMSALAAKGLASSPAGASAYRNYEGQRGTQIADFLSSLPFLERQEQERAIAMGMEMISRFGLGSDTTQSWWSKQNTHGASSSLTVPIPTDPNDPNYHLPPGSIPGTTSPVTTPGDGGTPRPGGSVREGNVRGAPVGGSFVYNDPSGGGPVQEGGSTVPYTMPDGSVIQIPVEIATDSFNFGSEDSGSERSRINPGTARSGADFLDRIMASEGLGFGPGATQSRLSNILSGVPGYTMPSLSTIGGNPYLNQFDPEDPNSRLNQMLAYLFGNGRLTPQGWRT